MRRENFSLLILLAVGLFFCGPPQFIQAESAKSSEIFVDLDGDGFDDNCSDEDSDGIPNDADSDYEPMPAGESYHTEHIIDFGQTIQDIGLSADLTTNSQRFGKRQFKTRGLVISRCGFDANAGFGSGNEIGIGVSSGGGCAGGVCGG